MENLKSTLRQLVHDQHAEIVEIRRHLHQHPELSFKEEQTAAYIQSKLESWGIKCQSGVAGTGIVAMIEGNDPTSKVVALRADMDALPITETNDISYKSQNEGVMHACGHDVHSSSLLGTAAALNQLKGQFSGSVKLIFQPGEEKLPGGASIMISEGVLQNPTPSSMLGQHVYPDLPAGKVGFKEGIYMASADEIYVTVKGRGGHAAMPHKNVDPILMASHMVVALQQLVSRFADPEIPTVLSFGKMIGKGATNVIPDEVKLEGTFRTFNEEWRADAHVRMKKLAEDLIRSMGGNVDFQIIKGYPFLVNHPETTRRAKQYAQEFLGPENVEDLRLRMTAEDFAWFSQEVNGCFYRLGTSSTDGSNAYPVHNSNFNIDEKALETGVGLMSWLTLRELGCE